MEESSRVREFHEAMFKNAAALSGRVHRYMQWNLSVFPIRKNRNILDLGSGPGMYFREIMAYQPSLYIAADNNREAVAAITYLMENRPNCQALLLDFIEQAAADRLRWYRFDYVLCLDVLEHIEDDGAALARLREIIDHTGRGKLFLRVPALPSLYGENDKAIGHYRRYSKRVLASTLNEAGFHVERISYHNALAVIPWWIIGTVLKRNLAVSSEEGGLFDALVPALMYFEKLVHPPIGLSLYAIGSLLA